MGWTSYYRAKGETDLAHLRRELIGEMTTQRILDGMTVRGVFYGVLEMDERRGEATGRVRVGLVVLQQRYRGGEDARHGNYARKEMDESMGPVESSCPERILRQLSPLSEVYPGADFEKDGCAKWAADWRARCEAGIAKAKARPKLKQGDTIKVSKPWKFRDGQERDTFILADAKRNLWRDLNGNRMRLPARDRWPAFEVIPAAPKVSA